MDLSFNQFLETLHQSNVRLRIEGDRLFCNAPDDALTPELLEEIGRRKPQLLTLLGATETGAHGRLPLLRRPDNDIPPPASFGQERLWLLQQMNPHSFGYNIPYALRLSGPLNVPAMESALTEIVRRHEVLRTKLVLMDGKLRQIVHPPVRVTLPRLPLAPDKNLDPEKELQDAITKLAQQPFDLTEFGYWRFTLFQLDAEVHVLLSVQHHIISDGWSIGILFSELGVLYRAFARGEKMKLPELPIQYGDYAYWQREQLQGARLEALTSWWKSKLANLPSCLDLPTDYPRPELQTDKGDWDIAVVGASTCTRLQEFCTKHGVTPFMTLLSIFAVFLSRFSRQTDFVVGTPTGSREHPDCEKLLGFFLNTLAIRFKIIGDPTFTDFVLQTRQTTLEAFAHQELPFEKLVEELQPSRDLSRSPIVQAMFIMHTQPAGRLDLYDLTIGHVPFESGTSKFDLTLAGTLTQNQLVLTLEYCTAVFERAMIRRMLGQIRELLNSALEAPNDRISLLRSTSASEREQVVQGWNQTESHFSRSCSVADLILQQILHTPERVAIRDGNSSWTYGELGRDIERFCSFFQSAGLRRGQRVAVYLKRSGKMVSALIALLRMGVAYMPLDEDLPSARREFMIADADVAAIVTQKIDRQAFVTSGRHVLCTDEYEPDTKSCASLSQSFANGSNASPEDFAYVIYTSGSTGEPKGVAVQHRSVVNFLLSMAVKPGISPADRVLAQTSLSFDISVLELLLPLTVGATLIVGTSEMAYDGRAIAQVLQAEDVTVMQATPTSWLMLLRSGWEGKSDLRALVGGETLSRQLAQDLLRRVGEVWNMYGPTETTVWSSVQRVVSDRANPTIGQPIANTQMYCLNEHLEPTPIGMPGDLYIAGQGLAAGYLNRPGLSASAFVPNPFSKQPGERMYRTGDVARFLGNGQLQFLGRSDRQVKVRGHRIELEEIEREIMDDPKVLYAVVDIENDMANHSLMAWIVPRHQQDLTVDEVRDRVSERLPAYMVPNRYAFLKELPTTTSGKLDRRGLPYIGERPSLAQEYVPPRGDVEERIAGIWRHALDVNRVGLHDNFFNLGGHSLALASVREQIRLEFSREISMIDLFRYPTISALARFLKMPMSQANR